MSDSILSAEINLPLLKWMTSFKLNSNLFSTSRNQSMKSINEIYRDLQYNIIPPKDEELQNLWSHLYDLNNYYSNSIEYNQVEKSLIGLKSKYRNSYLKGYYEIINLFQSIANDFEKVSTTITTTMNKNSVLDAINNRKNENKENSFKFLSSFESYVPTVEDIKRIYCIDNKDILVDKSGSLPVEYKLFHGFSLLNLYVYLIIVNRIVKLINEIYRQSSSGQDNQEIINMLKENSIHIKSIEDFQIQLKSNNLYYQPNKKEILLKYSVETNFSTNNNEIINNNSEISNNNSEITYNNSEITNNNSEITNNINNNSISINNNLNNNNIKTFEFSEKELKYSKRYYSFNEFTLRPAELPNNSLNIETQNLIFYTTLNYIGNSGSNNSNNNGSSLISNSNSGGNSSNSLAPKIKFNYHKPKDINPKIILAIYNNILSMSKVIDKKTIYSMNEIIKNKNNNHHNRHNSNSNYDDDDDDDEDDDGYDNEEYELSKEFNNQIEFGSEIIEQDKECYICRFRSEFISFCNYCKCRMVCDLCSVNKVCWNCYFKVEPGEEQKKSHHFIPLEVVVKLKDRKYPRLIYMLLRSYSFRDLMNTLYQNRFERDSTISAKDRLTYKLHKTKLYNFHLVIPNSKDPSQTKEIQIFDDYSFIIALRLLMNYILSNYKIDHKEILPQPIQQQQQQQSSSRPQSPPTVPSLTPINNHHLSGGSLLEHAIVKNFNSSFEVPSDDNNTSGSGSNSNSNTSGSYSKFINNNNNNNRKNSTGSGTNNNNHHSDNEYFNNNSNNNNNKIINNNSIVTIENPILWSIDKFTLNVTESSIDIEQSLRIPSLCIETDVEPFASGGQANIYMVKHIDWPMLSNCPEDSYVFKQFIETKDSLQLEEDREREIYEEKIYHTYKTGESADNFKYNFSNVEQTDKKSLETLFYEEVDKLKRLQFSDYIIKMPAISDDNPNKRGMLLECASAGSLKTNLLEYRSWKLVIRFMMDICLGMIDIHKCQIIHRDLKPDNILVFENFNSCDASDENDERQREFGGLICKITDLGASIQKELVHDNNFTSTFHTDDYVPEEYGRFQYDGEKVDIYSFGCTFFEMVTKHRYQYKHPTPLHRDFLTTDFQYIPIRIKTLIASLLAEQSQRKQSFEEVYNDLQDIYKNVIPGLPDIPLSPVSTNGSQFCKRCNPPQK
ncbi:hypothetical protein RB653_001094 [Dictyostelium firmibasis]|uniref:Protein kinase domain-containing protein n=1 Tax=Dictyostelium firmibasis TaxID=79012 RepID=A0AAN7U4H3_9MYCE